LCYAKITPAALRRSDCSDRRREDAEALGCQPEFELSQSRRGVAGSALALMQARRMAPS
jgi:hypothetical protein